MCPDNPVESVSWNEVQLFIRRLNAGLRSCKGEPGDLRGCYRCRQRAEWEWAVGAGTDTGYFFGNDSGQLGRYAVYLGNSGGRTHKVKGDRLPNQNGLYDVYGNVWEWVQDSWQKKLPGGKDPLVTRGSSHVVRGGGWSNKEGKLQSTIRPLGPERRGTAISGSAS